MTREEFIRQVEESQGELRRFLVALCCGSSHSADDIAQEAYLKAWLSLDSLNDESRFRGWVYRIACNVFFNKMRAGGALASSGYADALNVQAAETADSSFKYQELYDALNNISPRERTAILLHYMEGYAVKEIAPIIGASVDSVKQCLTRGRAHLRSLLIPQAPYNKA